MKRVFIDDHEPHLQKLKELSDENRGSCKSCWKAAKTGCCSTSVCMPLTAKLAAVATAAGTAN